MDSTLIWMGVLPIIAFLLLDSFADQKKALLGALALAIGEVIFSLLKFGSIDYLTWIAFGLLAFFVGLSIWKKDDIYFKIQGPFINTLTAILIWGALFFLQRNLILDMTEKYFGLDKLAALNPSLNVRDLKSYLGIINFHLPVWLVLHAGITLWAAFKWNKWAWAGIRIFGFYAVAFVVLPKNHRGYK